ncbi:DUF4388 domain-containing protein [bacterium]|nr:DUF4388 domain-containing protein [bacterium]
MGLKGSVKALSLDQLFEFLHASGHKGTLRVTHKNSTSKTLYLWQGGVYVERSEWSYRLGDVLIRHGVINRDQLEQALKAQKAAGAQVRLGDILGQLGFAKQEQILAARRKQVEEEIYDLFAWEDAVFEFSKDAFPAGFEQRLKDPEEFRYETRSVLIEATRRLDEWKRIHENIPSLKRIYLPEEKDREASAKRMRKAFVEMKVVAEPSVFDGRRTVDELYRVFGLSHFETLSLIARFVTSQDIRPLARHELEARFRMAVEEDLPYAVKLFECALETPEFEARAKYLDRALFGSAAFRSYIQKEQLTFTARVRGKRALELLLGIFRQGITCDFSATEEGRTLKLSFSKSALVWRGAQGIAPPNVVKHLLARSPIAAVDMARVEEMQRQSGRTLQQILVGGGYVTMDNWFRAQKDTVLNEVFEIFFWKKPFVEVHCGECKQTARPKPGLDIDVPMLPWLREEVTEEVKRWESIIAEIPSVRAYFLITNKGKNAIKNPFDVLALFDGKKQLEDIMKAQTQPPQAFFAWLYEQKTSGRIEALTEDDYRKRLDAAIAAGQRREAIEYCVAAIDSGLQIRYYQDRMKELEAAELELEAQAARPTLRGDLASFSLAEVLQTFYMSKRSGTLRIFEPKRSREIYFEDGEVYLLLDGYESGETSLQPLQMSANGMSETLSVQMKDELYEVFLWDAEFEFTADVLPAAFYTEVGKTYRVKINTQQFLMEAVRRIAEWEEVRATLPTDDLVVAFESYDEKMRAVTERGLADLLLLVDGRHTLADAIRMSGAGRFQALVLLAELTRQGALHLVTEEARAAKAAARAGRSGQVDASFVESLRALVGERVMGLIRATDGRRSKELAIVGGKITRTQPYRGDDSSETASLQDAARDLGEALSWKGARWEFLEGTLPPFLEKDESARARLGLETEVFLKQLEAAGKRWCSISTTVPKDKPLALVDDDGARAQAHAISERLPNVLALFDGVRTADDIARSCGNQRFLALSTILDLLEAHVAVVTEPQAAEEPTEEEWDLGLG